MVKLKTRIVGYVRGWKVVWNYGSADNIQINCFKGIDGSFYNIDTQITFVGLFHKFHEPMWLQSTNNFFKWIMLVNEILTFIYGFLYFIIVELESWLRVMLSIVNYALFCTRREWHLFLYIDDYVINRFIV